MSWNALGRAKPLRREMHNGITPRHPREAGLFTPNRLNRDDLAELAVVDAVVPIS
jgi:hypothetical protein